MAKLLNIFYACSEPLLQKEKPPGLSEGLIRADEDCLR